MAQDVLTNQSRVYQWCRNEHVAPVAGVVVDGAWRTAPMEVASEFTRVWSHLWEGEEGGAPAPGPTPHVWGARGPALKPITAEMLAAIAWRRLGGQGIPFPPACLLGAVRSVSGLR